MSLLRSCFAIIILLAIVSFIHVKIVHADQMDAFYKDFLIQRMMIAKVREFRGDVTAKSLFQSLTKEAQDIGIKLPKWSHSEPLEGVLKYSFRSGEKVDSKKYDSLIHKASRIYELPPALIKAVIHAESSFINDAISKKGAQGLMQLMPDTAKDLKIVDVFDPRINIFGGTRLLRKHIDEFGSLKRALIAYNAGPDRVRKGKRIPSETRKYIKRVIHYYRIYKIRDRAVSD